MIEVSLDTYFNAYMIILLILAGTFWAYHIYLSTTNKWTISQEKLCRCKSCSLIYVVNRLEVIARCPRCQELNQLNSKNRI